jgi:arylsulfatase A-like enzyme
MPFIKEFVTQYTPISRLRKEHCLIGLEYTRIGKKAKRWFERTRDENFLKTVIALYDGEIKYLDTEMGRLLTELKRLGVYDNSLVIFLSDHGDAFFEHGNFGHGNLYDETLRVPLIVHLPASLAPHAGKKINSIVSLVDVLPTVLDICSVPYRPKQFQGISLLSLVKNKPGDPRTFSFSEASEVKAVCNSKYKYMVYDIGRKKEREELYDLSLDPKETRNLLAASASDGKIEKTRLRLRKLLLTRVDKNAALREKMKSRRRKETKIVVNEDTRQQLRALGYMQ